MPKKIILQISNKVLYTFILITAILAVSIITYAYTNPLPNPGHGADSVLIDVDSTEKTIQQAVVDGNLGPVINCDFTNWEEVAP